MRPFIRSVKPCCTITTEPPIRLNKLFNTESQKSQPTKNLEKFLLDSVTPFSQFTHPTTRLAKRWMEYQGARNWEGLLDPLDDHLRNEIIRYGHFVEAAYKSFDFDASSPSYTTCKYPKSSLFARSNFPRTGYRVTKNLRVTSGIQLASWIKKGLSKWATRSSWIGYVAVCNDKEEIARLGRRDVVIAYRGTATCLEWLENLRATLVRIPNNDSSLCDEQNIPMVENGFLSLYTSNSVACPSLQYLIREEIERVLQMYPDEPLSITVTGHSLGAALATLTAYDIKTTFKHVSIVTVMSLGGPRVGNDSFRFHLEKYGVKILRIVNSDDLITKLPGFVIDNSETFLSNDRNVYMSCIFNWIQKRVGYSQWVYADVGSELRLRSRDSPYLNGSDVATCHDLKTYLHLVEGFVSSACPFRATAKRVLKKKPWLRNKDEPEMLH